MSSTESREKCELVPEIRPQLTENTSPVEVFEEVNGVEELSQIIVTPSSLCTQ